MASNNFTAKRYLVASDFDQDLSVNDSGELLAEFLGIPGFEEKVAEMAGQNLVQQGAAPVVAANILVVMAV